MRQDLLSRLALSVRNMDEEATKAAAREALSNQVNAITAINEGLLAGMKEAARLYEEGEYFVAESIWV
ncbi:Dimethylamine corrinoid protein (fragment) [Syntrophobacter sp. SbD1]